MKQCAIAIFHGLGDCVNATTIIQKIKRDYPSCKITWYTTPKYKGVVYANPDIHQIVLFHDKPWACDKRYGEVRAKFRKAIFPAPYYRNRSSDHTLLGNYKDIVARGYEGVPWKSKAFSFIPTLYNTESEKKFVNKWIRQNRIKKFVLMETKYTSSQSFWNDAYTTKAVKLLNERGYTVLLANEFKNFERYGDAIPLNMNYRFIPLFYNKAAGFIGVSSGLSCICHTTACVNDKPHLEFVKGAHWSTKNYKHKANKVISYNQSSNSVLNIIRKKF